ncbi:MAG: RNA-binding S4 domain-containing protein [Thiobacillus sp.]|nr:RNA-binding S4 domain-containing protein [Thiobacillus sp.]
MTPEKMPPDIMRIDKWLWAARFFKTRSLATLAVGQGRVKLNDDRAKPSREIKCGDTLDIHVADTVWTVTVCMLSLQRGPAPIAQRLYAETPASLARRQRQMAERKLSASPETAIKGRPTKRDRRQIHRFTCE